MANLAQFGSSSHETVGNVHSSAEVGHPEDEFDRINIGGNGNEFGFFLFNQFGDMVQSELDYVWLLFVDWFF